MTTGSGSKKLREWMREAAKALSEAGVDDSMQEIRFLLDRGMGMNLTQQFVQAELIPDEEWITKAERLLNRRLQREPLTSILGEQEFYGRPFTLNRSCLAPRPETEALVEMGLAWIKKQDLKKVFSIAEWCCGSAAPGISLYLEAQKLAQIKLDRLYLSDIQEEALVAARTNVARHSLEAHVDIECCDLFPTNSRQFDLVLVNPPYIESETVDQLMPEVREYEPRIALDGGRDGLDFYRRLANKAMTYLAPGGCLIMEHGYNQKDQIWEIFASWRAAGAGMEIVEDLAGLPRIAVVEL